MRKSFSSKALPSDSIAAGPRRANVRTPGRIDGCMCPQKCDTGVSLRDGTLAMTPAWSSRRRRLSTKHSRSSREDNSRNMQHRHFVFVSNPREIHEKTAQNSSFENPCCYGKKKKQKEKKPLFSPLHGVAASFSHSIKNVPMPKRPVLLILSLIILKQKAHLRRSQGEGGKKAKQITRTEEETEETPQ